MAYFNFVFHDKPCLFHSGSRGVPLASWVYRCIQFFKIVMRGYRACWIRNCPCGAFSFPRLSARLWENNLFWKGIFDAIIKIRQRFYQFCSWSVNSVFAVTFDRICRWFLQCFLLLFWWWFKYIIKLNIPYKLWSVFLLRSFFIFLGQITLGKTEIL